MSNAASGRGRLPATLGVYKAGDNCWEGSWACGWGCVSGEWGVCGSLSWDGIGFGKLSVPVNCICPLGRWHMVSLADLSQPAGVTAVLNEMEMHFCVRRLLAEPVPGSFPQCAEK